MFLLSTNIGISIYLVSFWDIPGKIPYMISTSSKERSVSSVSVVSVVHLHCQNILKKYKMGNFCQNVPKKSLL